jgi:hypothetical protein
MERQGAGDGLGSGRTFRQLDKRGRVAMLREGLPRVGKPLFHTPQKGDRRRPCRPIAGLLLRAQMSAEGQELSEVGDHAGISLLGDAHQTVRVEVVAEQNARVAVGRREQARAPVVEQVSLVNRFDAECEALIRQRREDRTLLPLGLRPKCCAPERTLPLRLPGNRLPGRGGP